MKRGSCRDDEVGRGVPRSIGGRERDPMDFNEKRSAPVCAFNPVGAIFMCNQQTRKECYQRGLFGLPSSQGELVRKIKDGMALFLFEYDERKLYGVFQATSNGAMDIVPNAFKLFGSNMPAQVRFRILRNCYPLKENEFRDAIRDNYFTAKKFQFGLSSDQVDSLMKLFESRMLTIPKRLTTVSSHCNDIDMKRSALDHPISIKIPKLSSSLHQQPGHDNFLYNPRDLLVFNEEPPLHINGYFSANAADLENSDIGRSGPFTTQKIIGQPQQSGSNGAMYHFSNHPVSFEEPSLHNDDYFCKNPRSLYQPAPCVGEFPQSDKLFAKDAINFSLQREVGPTRSRTFRFQDPQSSHTVTVFPHDEQPCNVRLDVPLREYANVSRSDSHTGSVIQNKSYKWNLDTVDAITPVYQSVDYNESLEYYNGSQDITTGPRFSFSDIDNNGKLEGLSKDHYKGCDIFSPYISSNSIGQLVRESNVGFHKEGAIPVSMSHDLPLQYPLSIPHDLPSTPLQHWDDGYLELAGPDFVDDALIQMNSSDDQYRYSSMYTDGHNIEECDMQFGSQDDTYSPNHKKKVVKRRRSSVFSRIRQAPVVRGRQYFDEDALIEQTEACSSKKNIQWCNSRALNPFIPPVRGKEMRICAPAVLKKMHNTSHGKRKCASTALESAQTSGKQANGFCSNGDAIQEKTVRKFVDPKYKPRHGEETGTGTQVDTAQMPGLEMNGSTCIMEANRVNTSHQFINFKRRNVVSKENAGACITSIDSENTEACSGKVKRRKLVRPFFGNDLLSTSSGQNGFIIDQEQAEDNAMEGNVSTKLGSRTIPVGNDSGHGGGKSVIGATSQEHGLLNASPIASAHLKNSNAESESQSGPAEEKVVCELVTSQNIAECYVQDSGLGQNGCMPCHLNSPSGSIVIVNNDVLVQEASGGHIHNHRGTGITTETCFHCKDMTTRDQTPVCEHNFQSVNKNHEEVGCGISDAIAECDNPCEIIERVAHLPSAYLEESQWSGNAEGKNRIFESSFFNALAPKKAYNKGFSFDASSEGSCVMAIGDSVNVAECHNPCDSNEKATGQLEETEGSGDGEGTYSILEPTCLEAYGLEKADDKSCAFDASLVDSDVMASDNFVNVECNNQCLANEKVALFPSACLEETQGSGEREGKNLILESTCLEVPGPKKANDKGGSFDASPEDSVTNSVNVAKVCHGSVDVDLGNIPGTSNQPSITA